MGITNWLGHNWFAISQTAAVTAGLAMLGLALFLEAKARRVANLLQLTQQHRDLWERMFSQPELERILDPDANLEVLAVTSGERMFVIFIILHLSSTYYAMRSGFFQKPHGLRKDIQHFFSLPIPRAVWEEVKILQDRPFVMFVERCWPEFDSVA